MVPATCANEHNSNLRNIASTLSHSCAAYVALWSRIVKKIDECNDREIKISTHRYTIGLMAYPYAMIETHGSILGLGSLGLSRCLRGTELRAFLHGLRMSPVSQPLNERSTTIERYVRRSRQLCCFGVTIVERLTARCRSRVQDLHNLAALVVATLVVAALLAE